MDVAGRLRLAIIRQGLDAEFLINNCGTIDLCDIGPNVVIYPDNIVYYGVTVKDIPEVIEYLKGGPVIDRLLLKPGSGQEQARRRFYEGAVASGDTVRPDLIGELALGHGFDDTWIAGQISRGFMARKPDPETGENVLSVTKKARDRYGI